MAAMRRWVLMVMLLVLPFQLVWGAAAPYCAHEASASVDPHFGHHEHQHGADAPGDASSEHSASKLPGGNDLDCGLCHGACCGLLAPRDTLPATGVAAPPQMQPQAGLPTALQSPPDRPQWLRLA